MENSFYDLANQISIITKCLKTGDESGARNATLIAKNINARMADNKTYTKFQVNLVFVDVLNFMTLDSDKFSDGQRKCIAFLREIYGDQNIVLSDICKLF